MDFNADEAALFADIDGIDAAPVAPPAPPPVAAPATPAAPACTACNTALNPENGSKLQDGTWKHIGCPKDAAPAPEAKPRRRKLPIVDTEAPAAPAPAAAPAAPAPAPAAPVAPVAHADSPRQVIAHTEPVVNLPIAVTPPNTAAHLALADLFENIARLLRKT